VKAILAALWIACAVAFVLPDDSAWATPGRRLFFALLVVHAIEVVAFLPRLRAAGGSLAHHVVQTLLFGFVHLRTLPARS
jgi:uncharacterized protein YhhL (DUF1145 family)